MDQGGSGGGATGASARRSRPSALKMSKDSRAIRKPPVPLPVVQYRQPVIIHTYSPKVIETDATNFMWLVQRLTGSSDTRRRCKTSKPAVLPTFMPSSPSHSPRSLPTTARNSSPWKREIVEEEPVINQRHRHHQLSGSPSSEEAEDPELLRSSSAGDDDSSSISDLQQQFKVEHLLLSPASSSDSGNPFHRLANPLLASPKSPLVSFDAAGLAFGDQHRHFLPNPFSTSSSLASNGEPSVYVPQMTIQQQQPWSPIFTPSGISHADFLPEFDLWTTMSSSSSEFHGLSPRSKLFGPMQSPATMAFRDMAFAFVKD
ncbi:hypothetical protein SELMODRAFT_409496 [Selaginella moellendorffii]|uniref:VQ domain-containing protein n=1 Tax=Selaginella moellendorffii TaxID=88036 RepID=D8RBM6_SELML|nr:uncharacterized protein LOC9631445 [Selaginella moellendorffii]EFJ30524.1 hypothetical protein SELMODRAFT_409496 [Selaginella moellendorffii]|eukprot:XP_002968270.1 uncharacterized protein LOC9631445 [Selaginella moellendorffii]